MFIVEDDPRERQENPVVHALNVNLSSVTREEEFNQG